ncbi:MAG: hypothetical protein ACYTFG_06235, partial [Planctomycetota bacterium]
MSFRRIRKKTAQETSEAPRPPSDEIEKPWSFLQQLDCWFVRYNPLYFFSAFLVLGGVYFMSRGLHDVGWKGGEFLLTAVVQAYELLLIGACALLFRVARQKRPAVILAVVEIFFLFDWTFRTEALGTAGEAGGTAAAIWALLIPLKVCSLLWIFELRVRPLLVIVPSLAAAVLALSPHVLTSFFARENEVHLVCTWVLVALASSFIVLRPRLEALTPLDRWGRFVLRRVEKTIW